MPFLDLPLTELRAYRPTVAEPADFDGFWDRTLAEARAFGGTPLLERFEAGLSTVEVWDVTFPGFGGNPVKEVVENF